MPHSLLLPPSTGLESHPQCSSYFQASLRHAIKSRSLRGYSTAWFHALRTNALSVFY